MEEGYVHKTEGLRKSPKRGNNTKIGFSFPWNMHIFKVGLYLSFRALLECLMQWSLHIELADTVYHVPLDDDLPHQTVRASTLCVRVSTLGSWHRGDT